MNLTRTISIHLLKILGITLAVALIVAYAIFRSFNYAKGPQIIIFEPSNGASISSSSVIVRGLALRINSVSLNGNSLLLDEKGNFKETVVIFPGMNQLTLVAQDQFGRSTQTQIDVVGH